MVQGVNFTQEAARRITDAVKKIEQLPTPTNTQRRRAGGLGRSTLWEVTAVQTGPKTVTIKRVENQDGDLVDASERTEILYDPDNEPTVGAKGLLIRYGDGTMAFFIDGTSGGRIAPAQITSGGPGNTYIGNIYGNGTDQAATATGVTIKVLQIDSGDTVPSGTWLPAFKPGIEGFWTVDVARYY